MIQLRNSDRAYEANFKSPQDILTELSESVLTALDVSHEADEITNPLHKFSAYGVQTSKSVGHRLLVVFRL